MHIIPQISEILIDAIGHLNFEFFMFSILPFCISMYISVAHMTENTKIKNTMSNICANHHLFVASIYIMNICFLVRWMMNPTTEPMRIEETLFAVAQYKVL